jgi:4-hydroxybenzoate polyprenyltransferase
VNVLTFSRATTKPLGPLLLAMRPQQWPKNGLVFAAFVFSMGQAWTLGDAGAWWPLLWRSIALFWLWAAASSATYLFNDIRDRDIDQLHPRKRSRPIASGELSTGVAGTAAVVLAVAGVIPAILLDTGAGLVLAGYVLLMAVYSVGLKGVAIIDIFVLGAGVIGRAVSGALVIDVEISPWLYVCSTFGALFFATSKRWAEFRQLGAAAAKHRPSLAHYNGEVLGHMLFITAAAALISYALYTIESDTVPDNGAMALTIPFVAFALFRYLLLLSGERKEDAPDQVLFTDPQIVLAVVGFVGVAGAVLALT